MRKLSKLTLLLTALFTLSLASVPVYAEGGTSNDANQSGGTPTKVSSDSEVEQSTSTSTTTSGTEQEDRSTTTDKNAENETGDNKGQNKSHDNAGATVAAEKQKQCTRREKTVGTILSHIANRGQRQVDLFNTIATRVENFATTNNKQPADYQALVDAVNTAHDNAVAAVTAIQTDSTNVNLNCDNTSGSNGVANSFKAELKSEISALQAYRTAVKNLIVGVKSVTNTTSSTDNTSTTGGTN